MVFCLCKNHLDKLPITHQTIKESDNNRKQLVFLSICWQIIENATNDKFSKNEKARRRRCTVRVMWRASDCQHPLKLLLCPSFNISIHFSIYFHATRRPIRKNKNQIKLYAAISFANSDVINKSTITTLEPRRISKL